MGNILKKVSLLRGGTKPCTVHSEADLRFAITDPIMEMISDCWGCQVRTPSMLNLCISCALATGEAGGESGGRSSGDRGGGRSSGERSGRSGTPPNGAVPEHIHTPGTNTRQSISDNSRADYSIYTIRREGKTILAVLLEAKLTSHRTFCHAVGQVWCCNPFPSGGINFIFPSSSLATM